MFGTACRVFTSKNTIPITNSNERSYYFDSVVQNVTDVSGAVFAFLVERLKFNSNNWTKHRMRDIRVLKEIWSFTSLKTVWSQLVCTEKDVWISLKLYLIYRLRNNFQFVRFSALPFFSYAIRNHYSWLLFQNCIEKRKFLSFLSRGIGIRHLSRFSLARTLPVAAISFGNANRGGTSHKCAVVIKPTLKLEFVIMVKWTYSLNTFIHIGEQYLKPAKCCQIWMLGNVWRYRVLCLLRNLF